MSLDDPDRKLNRNVIPRSRFCPCGEKVTVYRAEDQPGPDPVIVQVVLCEALHEAENTYALAERWRFQPERENSQRTPPGAVDDIGRFNYVGAHFIAALMPLLGGPCASPCLYRPGRYAERTLSEE